MYRVKTFGGLACLSREQPAEPLPLQRYPLALLAVLAASGSEGVPRDRVLLYLWPESDTTRARNSLNQTLYAIRRDLGASDLVLGARSGHLRLNPLQFSCDLWDFEAAIDGGEVRKAVAFYTGPFLDGFSLPGLAELEEWIEEQRSRVRQRYAEALEALAGRAADRGEHALAAEYWRRLVWQAPLSGKNALGFMRALVAAGDRGAALDYARNHEARVREELGTAPDAAVTEYAERLRGEPASGRVGPNGPPGPAALNGSLAEAVDARPDMGEGTPVAEGPRVSPGAHLRLVTEEWHPEPAGVTDPAGPAGKEPPSEAPAHSRRFPLGWVAWVAGGIVLAAAVVWWLVSRPAPDAGPSLSGTTVAVFPFAVTGGAEVQRFRPAAAELLASGLDGAGPLRSADPRAAAEALGDGGAATPDQATAAATSLGAGLYALGELVENGGRVRIGASLYDTRAGGTPVARASVDGEAGRIFELIDTVAVQLIAQQQRHPADRIARAAAGTAGSLAALKTFLRSEEDYREGRYASAVEGFSAAVAQDSGFALAHYRLGTAADRAGRDSLAAAALDRARRYAMGLPDVDRRLIEAYAAGRSGAIDAAERLYREIVSDHPGDHEAWFQFGELVFHGNPLRGRSAVEARPAFAEVVQLDPANAEALMHLARIASLEGDGDTAARLIGRILSSVPGPQVVRRAFRGFVLGDRPAGERAANDLLARPPEIAREEALEVAVRAGDVTRTERFARKLADAESRDVRAFGHRLLAQLAVAQGRWRVATAELEAGLQLDAGPVLRLHPLLAVLPFLAVPPEELAALRRQIEGWNPSGESGDTSAQATYSGLYPGVRLYRLGLLSAKLGDLAAAERYAAELERGGATGDPENLERTMAESIRAWIAWQAGRPADVLTHLDAARWERGASVLMAEALDRYLRAEALHALGRNDEALGWYASMAERAAYELPYLAPATLRQAEIYEARGERGRAVEYYRRFLSLWDRADPELRPVLEEARRRLERLEAAGK